MIRPLPSAIIGELASVRVLASKPQSIDVSPGVRSDGRRPGSGGSGGPGDASEDFEYANPGFGLAYVPLDLLQEFPLDQLQRTQDGRVVTSASYLPEPARGMYSKMAYIHGTNHPPLHEDLLRGTASFAPSSASSPMMMRGTASAEQSVQQSLWDTFANIEFNNSELILNRVVHKRTYITEMFSMIGHKVYPTVLPGGQQAGRQMWLRQMRVNPILADPVAMRSLGASIQSERRSWTERLVEYSLVSEVTSEWPSSKTATLELLKKVDAMAVGTAQTVEKNLLEVLSMMGATTYFGSNRMPEVAQDTASMVRAIVDICKLTFLMQKNGASNHLEDYLNGPLVDKDRKCTDLIFTRGCSWIEGTQPRADIWPALGTSPAPTPPVVMGTPESTVVRTSSRGTPIHESVQYRTTDGTFYDPLACVGFTPWFYPMIGERMSSADARAYRSNHRDIRKLSCMYGTASREVITIKQAIAHCGVFAPGAEGSPSAWGVDMLREIYQKAQRRKGITPHRGAPGHGGSFPPPHPPPHGGLRRRRRGMDTGAAAPAGPASYRVPIVPFFDIFDLTEVAISQIESLSDMAIDEMSRLPLANNGERPPWIGEFKLPDLLQTTTRTLTPVYDENWNSTDNNLIPFAMSYDAAGAINIFRLATSASDNHYAKLWRAALADHGAELANKDWKAVDEKDIPGFIRTHFSSYLTNDVKLLRMYKSLIACARCTHHKEPNFIRKIAELLIEDNDRRHGAASGLTDLAARAVTALRNSNLGATVFVTDNEGDINALTGDNKIVFKKICTEIEAGSPHQAELHTLLLHVADAKTSAKVVSEAKASGANLVDIANRLLGTEVENMRLNLEAYALEGTGAPQSGPTGKSQRVRALLNSIEVSRQALDFLHRHDVVIPFGVWVFEPLPTWDSGQAIACMRSRLGRKRLTNAVDPVDLGSIAVIHDPPSLVISTDVSSVSTKLAVRWRSQAMPINPETVNMHPHAFSKNLRFGVGHVFWDPNSEHHRHKARTLELTTQPPAQLFAVLVGYEESPEFCLGDLTGRFHTGLHAAQTAELQYSTAGVYQQIWGWKHTVNHQFSAAHFNNPALQQVTLCALGNYQVRSGDGWVDKAGVTNVGRGLDTYEFGLYVSGAGIFEGTRAQGAVRVSEVRTQ